MKGVAVGPLQPRQTKNYGGIVANESFLTWEGSSARVGELADQLSHFRILSIVPLVIAW